MKNPLFPGRIGFLPLLTLLGIISWGPTAEATDYNYTGANDGNWSMAGNWSPAVVPGSGDNIIQTTNNTGFRADGTNTVTNFTFDVGGSSPTIAGSGGAGANTLTISGTLTSLGTGGPTFRNSVGTLALNVGTIVIPTGAQLWFGNPNNSLASIITSGSTTIAGTGLLEVYVAGGTAAFNGGVSFTGNGNMVLNDSLAGTGNTVSVAYLSDINGASTVAATRTATSGLNTTATLNINGASGSNTYAGQLLDNSLAGTGNQLSIIKSGAGTQILTGTNAYTGTTTVNGGTLQLGDGTAASNAASFGSGILAANAGTLAFDPSSTATYTVSNAITGAGAINQAGAGTTVLSGNDSAFTGATTVNAGLLQVVGTLGSAASTLTVASGGTLGGGGTAGGNVIVQSGGTLAPGDPQAFHINGNLTLNPGSNTVFQIAGLTPGTGYDQILVLGSAALGGTAFIQPTGGFVPKLGETFTLITASGGVTGQFTAGSSLGNALSYLYVYNPNSLVVDIVQGSFQAFAGTPNQQAVAANLDKAALDPRAVAVIGYLDGLAGTQLPAAFDQIAPTSLTSLPPILFSDTRATFQTLNQRLSEIRQGSTGLSLSQLNLMEGNIPIPNLLADTEGVPIGAKPFIPSAENRWGFFASANGDFGDIDGSLGIPNSNFYGGGMMAGADYRVTPNLAVGFAAGYNRDQDDFSDSSDISVNSARFGPYATWKDQGGDWVNGTVGGAYHWFNSSRAALGGTATGDTTGEEFDASGTLGHDFNLGSWTLTPTLGLDYVRLHTEAFTESGSMLPLSLSSQESDSLQSVLGGTIAYGFCWKGVQWKPYLQAGWNHEMLDPSQAATARFASGAGGLFTVYGYDVDRESASFGAGIDAILTKALSADFSYNGQVNSNYQSHSFEAGLKIAF